VALVAGRLALLVGAAAEVVTLPVAPAPQAASRLPAARPSAAAPAARMARRRDRGMVDTIR
jgi:hypothetical protein